MAEKEKKADAAPPRITEAQRFSYIGFEVFPGKPKDLFKNEAERDQLVKKVKARRDKGDTIRDHNTLMDERLSGGERMVLTLACLVILGSLFLPWFSAYTETERAVVQAPAAVVAPDSLIIPGDTTLALKSDQAAGSSEVEPVPPGEGGEVGEVPAVATPEGAGGEEIIHAGISHKKFDRVDFSVNWFGSLGVLGAAGGLLFGSAITAVSSVLMLVYMVLALVLPLFTLFNLYGSKAKGDDLALKLKKSLRLNWLPLVIFVLVAVLSFLGGAYAGAVPYTSLGDSYSVAAFGNLLSYGVFVSLGFSVMLAVKGIEI
jgi:hypothetical protein